MVNALWSLSYGFQDKQAFFYSQMLQQFEIQRLRSAKPLDYICTVRQRKSHIVKHIEKWIE